MEIPRIVGDEDTELHRNGVYTGFGRGWETSMQGGDDVGTRGVNP